jgi:putative SOS response-associated peptidase YedK
VLESFTVLTVPASPAMEVIHKRQPLMLSVADARSWMDPDFEAFETFIRSELPVAMDAIPVSTHVNNARNKDERCMDPIGKTITLDDSGALL